MRALLAAELRKLWTVRTVLALTAFGLGVVALTTVTAAFGGLATRPGGPPLNPTAVAIDQLGGTTLFVLVVGLLVMTTEFRHATIGRTLQLEPSRLRVLAAKLAAGGLYAVVFFALALVLVGVEFLIAAAAGMGTLQVNGEVVRAVWQGSAGMMLTGLLGVAVGALLRSQVWAITGSLVWLLLVENLAAALRPDVGRWLPFQALNALFLSREAVGSEPGVIGPLPPLLALVVFLAYVTAATLAAAVLMRRRDV